MKYSDEKDMQNFKKIDISSWDNIKDNVFVRVMNRKYLSKYDDNIAHVPFLDLILTFSVQEKSKEGTLSHMLTNEDLESFNVSAEEVKKVALCNTTYNRKKRLMTLKESALTNNPMYPIIQSYSGMALGARGHSESECGIVQDTDEELGVDNVLVLCNKSDTFGASYIASSDVLEEIYNRFHENFYIIPLSIHQVMCVRASYATRNGEKLSYEVDDDFLEMIEMFNDNNNKSWKDILSYKIYYYFGDDGKGLFVIK